VSGEARPGLLAAISLGLLAGAGALAWFSAVQTLQLTRPTATAPATVSLQSHLFGLVRVSDTRLVDVRSARVVTTIPDVSRPRPYTQLFFDTPSGAVDLFTPQQTFQRTYSDIEAFFQDPAQRTATFSSLVDGRETVRFVFAQIVAVSLFLCGAGLIYMVARSLFGTDTSIGPR
jgi:hypothetical protein